MCWTEIIIKISSKDVEEASSIANMVVPYGIYIEDYSNLEEEVYNIAHIDLIQDELLKKDRNSSMIHIYMSPEEDPTSPVEAIAFLRERLNYCGIENEILTSKCRQEDFINNYKKYFKPTKVGKKLLINPVWEKCKKENGRVILNIEPGLAFGTGTHQTTKLCIELIEKYLKSYSKVLDVGCGSGILSVASILLGAQSATGVDIDKMAIKTAIQNASINNVEDRFLAVEGNLIDHVSGRYDLIVANIVADAIISLTQKVSKFMKDDAVYIVSGIISQRKIDVINSLKSNFEILQESSKDDWVAIAACQKKQ